jgi:PiT family inorganic phosphate transporter
MSETHFVLLAAIILLTLIFDYINGFHDAANAIATVVSTRVLPPRTAVLYGAAFNFLGALMGTQVATTIGSGLVQEHTISLETIFFALITAIIWNLLTWYKGLPTSSSHALIGSLLGATFFSTPGGLKSIQTEAVMQKVLTPMLLSPLIGFGLGFLVMVLLSWLVYRMDIVAIKKGFGKLQIVSSGLVALSHGHNDAQKSMGIIALALMTAQPAKAFHLPIWVILVCALAMGAGTMSGGWRIIRTVGRKMIKLQPIHGFAAETTSAAVILGASGLGIPLSTTQVISSAIMGVGATRRTSALKWHIVRNIVYVWLLTIPMTFILSGLLVCGFQFFTE